MPAGTGKPPNEALEPPRHANGFAAARMENQCSLQTQGEKNNWTRTAVLTSGPWRAPALRRVPGSWRDPLRRDCFVWRDHLATGRCFLALLFSSFFLHVFLQRLQRRAAALRGRAARVGSPQRYRLNIRPSSPKGKTIGCMLKCLIHSKHIFNFETFHPSSHASPCSNVVQKFIVRQNWVTTYRTSP